MYTSQATLPIYRDLAQEFFEHSIGNANVNSLDPRRVSDMAVAMEYFYRMGLQKSALPQEMQFKNISFPSGLVESLDAHLARYDTYQHHGASLVRQIIKEKEPVIESQIEAYALSQNAKSPFEVWDLASHRLILVAPEGNEAGVLTGKQSAPTNWPTYEHLSDRLGRMRQNNQNPKSSQGGTQTNEKTADNSGVETDAEGKSLVVRQSMGVMKKGGRI